MVATKKKVTNPKPITKIQLRKIKKLLTEAKVPDSYRFNHYSISWRNFQGWLKEAEKVDDPDKARFVIYYGFQPLYDALISDWVEDKQRKDAIKCLNIMIQAGIEYLTAYYEGSADLAIIHKMAKNVENLLPLDCCYEPKFRNVDYNGVTACSIRKFLLTWIDDMLSNEVPIFTSIVGCACGSAEIVMPMAGILGVQLYFLRRSWRRGDDTPKVIREHSVILKDGQMGAVACVEDYVCSGNSLGRVMDEIVAVGADKVLGFSVCGGDEASYIRMTKDKQKYHIYERSK